jgi:hypothetical protein
MSPIHNLINQLNKFQAGAWTEEDFIEIARTQIEARADTIQGIMLDVEPLAPRYYKYQDAKILGGNGWWRLEDGSKFKDLLKVLDHIDKLKINDKLVE